MFCARNSKSTNDGGEEFRGGASRGHEGGAGYVLAQMETLKESKQSSAETDVTRRRRPRFLCCDDVMMSSERTSECRNDPQPRSLARPRALSLSYLADLLQRRNKVVIAHQGQSVEHVDRLQGAPHEQREREREIINS